MSRSHLERVEEQVAEEANKTQHGAFGNRLVDDEGEEDGVNPQQRNESQSGFSQSAPKRKSGGGGVVNVGGGGGGGIVGGVFSVIDMYKNKESKSLRMTSRWPSLTSTEDPEHFLVGCRR